MAGTAKYQKTTPEGVDVIIQELQDFFVRELFTAKTWNVYGRAYLNEKDGETLPEVFNGKDYEDVLLNDAVSHCFFLLDENRQFESGRVTATLNIYFLLDLSVISSLTHRADEETLQDIIQLLELEPYGFVLTSFVTGLTALSAFGKDTTNDDLQPFFVVRFEGTIIYEPINC